MGHNATYSQLSTLYLLAMKKLHSINLKYGHNVNEQISLDGQGVQDEG